ncbi:MAG TPA: hypothetical protein VM537_32200 [Anaerolineae bacterium]|nr:hypothetical protein [Anaerolineae bacterium]
MNDIGISDVWRGAAFVIAIQMAAFAWRVSREVAVADRGDVTWLPPADIMNLVAIVVAFLGVFVLPVLGIGSSTVAALALGLSIVLFVGYPFAIAGHYDLFERGPRSWAPAPRQEKLAIAATSVAAALCLGVVALAQFR